MKYLNGNDLTPAQRRDALTSFVNRFTGNHKPHWARQPRPDGEPYPLQFSDDADWLAHTTFAVCENGKLAARHGCHSNPTWPNGK
jgi:hypothetical protein